ncbi:MAG: hexose kinase [Anaerolineae bacterium]|nr:hexose kinase [Anaerolineae bacterium]
MKAVLALGAHPSLERTILIPGFQAGQAFRVQDSLTMAGSKGFNFARALHAMGHTATVVTPLAGHTGQYVADLAAEERLDCAAVWVPGQTRQIVNVIDPDNGRYTELIENGPTIGATEWEAIRACVQAHLDNAAYLVVCGSLLPGTPVKALRQVIEMADRAGVPVVLDTYGLPLKYAISCHSTLLKINGREAGDLLGRPSIQTQQEAIQAAAEIRRLGPQAVIITLGALGAGGIDAAGTVFGWQASHIERGCAIGSGDAMLGALIARWREGASLSEATRWGVAIGAANILTLGAAHFDRRDADRLYTQTTAW